MGRRGALDTPSGVVKFVLNTIAVLTSQRGYDRLAPFYQAIEWLVFGNRLQQARTALLEDLPPWRRLLLLGDGDGRLLQCLCASAAAADQAPSSRPADRKILSVDLSRAMLERQQAGVETTVTHICVEYLQRDACHYIPEPGIYDVLLTPFFLDCFSRLELETHLPNWLTALRPGGVLYHIDFVLPAGGWQRPAGWLLITLMHLFFRWQTGLQNRRLVDPQPLFEQHGFRKVAERFGVHGLVVSQLWEKPS